MYIPFRTLLPHLSKSHQNLLKTKQLHAMIAKTHLSQDPFYATRIIRYYGLNGDLDSAHQLFDESPDQSIYLWNSIIRAHAQNYDFCTAFHLFNRLLTSDTDPDNFTFACVLRACSDNHDVEGVRLAHGGLLVSGFGMDSICCSALVSAYSKLGLIDYASKVFHKVDELDLAMWNSLLHGYVHCGLLDKGLELFNAMRNNGIKPDGYGLVALLSGLAESRFLEVGQEVHGLCIKSGFHSNAFIGSSLVTMYSRCACLDSAKAVFCSLEQPDLVTWSAMITGMVHIGDTKNAFLFFRNRNMGGMKSDPVLIATILVASSQLANVGLGFEIHGYILRHGLETDIMVSSSLIDMYSKCGFVDLGVRVFNVLPRRNIVTYNSAILGLGSHGRAEEAFRLFYEVFKRGFRPDESTFSAILHTCIQAGLVKEGEEIFNQMKYKFSIEPRNEHFVYMIKIFGMAGRFEDAYNLIVSLPQPIDAGIWGALLTCCEMHGNTVLAERILQHIFENEPQKNSYSVQLSKIYADHGRWDDVETLRGDNTDSRQRKVPGLSWIGGGNP